MPRALLVVLGFALAIALALSTRSRPAPVPASAPLTEFSSERALVQLRTIAAKPHRVGTAADAYVEKYLVEQLEALGFNVRVQAAISVENRYVARGWPVVAGSVRNIVARRRGSASGPCPPCTPPRFPALMLTSHYDSRELAPGAGDDGYGTAALLETARALAASPPLVHDVVLLFSEGEEEGLLGAKAFVAFDPEARDIGLVLNFEARGDAGPVLMFQTSPDASDLIDVLARSVPDVRANSLSAAIYRRLPNDTDLSVWLGAQHAGMNFANVAGVERYHQATDSVANAEQGSIQHQGSYALGLARAFGIRETMVRSTGREEVYFDLGPLFVHYRAGVAVPLAAGALVLLVTVVGLGIRRGRFRARGVVAGAAGALGIPIVAGALGWAVGAVTGSLHGGALAQQVARGDLKSALFAGLLLLGAATAWAGWARLARVFRPADVGVGAALPWAVAGLVLAVVLPGGSFLLAWPVVLAAIAWSIEAERAAEVAHLLAAIAAIAVLLPLAMALGVTFGLPAAPGLTLFPALAASFAVVPIMMVEAARRWVGAAALAAVGLVAVVYASVAAPFNTQYPRPDTLIYVVDADHDTPWWISTDESLDPWTSKLLQGAESVRASEVFGGKRTDTMFRVHAPPVPYEKPRIDVLSSEGSGPGRQLHLRVVLPAGTDMVDLAVPAEAKVTSATVAGFPATPAADGSFQLYFYGPPAEGFDLVLVTPTAGPIPIQVLAQSRGFPAPLAADIEARPAGLMPRNNWDQLRASDMTLVSASFHL